jgi:hypothetical protein
MFDEIGVTAFVVAALLGVQHPTYGCQRVV